jgi:hypothetical protein
MVFYRYIPGNFAELEPHRAELKQHLGFSSLEYGPDLLTGRNDETIDLVCRLCGLLDRGTSHDSFLEDSRAWCTWDLQALDRNWVYSQRSPPLF